MAKIIIPVNQQLDKCGDEFLDERDFEMSFEIDDNSTSEYIPFSFGAYKDCFIKRSDLKQLIAVLGCKP